jgi:hypothetical protein
MMRAFRFFVIAMCAASTALAQDVRFRWAFGVATGAGQARHFAPITSEDVTLRAGDEIKMFVGPECKCFIYVLHQDQAGQFTVLYPADGAFTATPPSAASYIPAGGGWLEVDDSKGIERIYLLASTTRLTALEQLLTAAASTAKPPSPAQQIVGELARLQKTTVARNWSERPVTMGGQVRAKQDAAHPDIARNATEITGNAPFFSRVFIIDHR